MAYGERTRRLRPFASGQGLGPSCSSHRGSPGCDLPDPRAPRVAVPTAPLGERPRSRGGPSSRDLSPGPGPGKARCPRRSGTDLSRGLPVLPAPLPARGLGSSSCAFRGKEKLPCPSGNRLARGLPGGRREAAPAFPPGRSRARDPGEPLLPCRALRLRRLLAHPRRLPGSPLARNPCRPGRAGKGRPFGDGRLLP